MQSRYRSKALWVSVAALILFVLKNYGLLDDLGLNDDSFNTLVNMILAILIGFGIINNPTNKEGL